MGRFIITELKKHEHYRSLAWFVCMIGASFYCYEYFLRIAPSVMSNELMRAFHLDATSFGDLVAFFYYVYTPMQLVVGVLMDRYGPRRLLVLACLACIGGVLLFGTTHVVAIAAIGRLLIGFGAAFAFVGALKLASIWLPPERFATVSGLVTALGMVGAMSSDIVMAYFVEKSGWQATLIFLAVIGAVLMVLIFLIVRDRVKTQQKIAWFLPELSFKDVFIGLLQAIRRKDLWINGIIGCMMYMPVTVFAELWGIPYLMQAHHLSHMVATEIVSMVFLGFAIGGTLAGWLSDLIRRRRFPLRVGAILAFLISCIIIYFPPASDVALTMLFFMLGFVASTQVIVFAIGREVSPPHIAGTAISFTNMLTMIGGALFQPFLGWLLDVNWHGGMMQGIRIYSASDYTIALTVLPLGLLITIALTFFLKETYCELVSE